MEQTHKQYYYDMAQMGRLIPIYIRGQIIGVITFFITNTKIDRYLREDMWSIVADEPTTGKTCYVDHLITDGNGDGKRHSFVVWKEFKRYIKQQFPQVTKITWFRNKGGIVHVSNSSIK